VVILGGLVAGLLLAEVLLRVLGYSYPLFHRADMHRGWVLRPGAEGWFRGEGRAYVRINRDGLRDRDHDFAKPAGAYRIAILGDSMAEAMQVDRENAFPALLERDLAGCAALHGQKPEVINLGVNGYGTAQELIALREQGWKYQPDLVLLAFFLGNDVRNNHPVLNAEPASPYFVFRGSELVQQNPAGFKTDAFQTLVRPALEILSDYSRIAQLCARAWDRLAARRSGRMELNNTNPPETGEHGVDDAVFSPPKDQNWVEAWRVTEALLRMMNDEVRAHRAEFRIVLLTTGIQVYPDAAGRERYRQRVAATSLLYPDERLESWANQYGIPVIAPVQSLRAYAESHQALLHGFANAAPGFGHLNELGHRLTAEYIAQSLCSDSPAALR
jgi:hypothetical protein